MQQESFALIEKLMNRHKDDVEIMSFIEKIGPTVLGIKPASLLNVSGRVLILCWNCFDESSGIAYEMVKCGEGRVQLLIYHSKSLAKVLGEPKTKRCLMRLGYPAAGTVNDHVACLASRMQDNEYPHEIGLFLGYPLKDVYGFMGAPIPYRKTMGWRMYGDVRPSESIYYAYKAARNDVRNMMKQACCNNI